MTELLSFYKDLYEQEVGYSERLNGKIGNSLAILTVIGSGHVLLATELFPIQLPRSIWSVAFFALFCLSLFFLYKSIYWFKKAYSGFEYAYFPIEGMNDAIRKSIGYGKKHGEEQKANEHIISMITDMYRDSAIHNRGVNKSKNDMHYKLANALIRSFSTLVLTFMSWIVFFRGNMC